MKSRMSAVAALAALCVAVPAAHAHQGDPNYLSQVDRVTPSAGVAVEVPDDADRKGAPRWEEVDKAGRFEWHDHRMHWMAETKPPQVEDQSVETKIFDWTIPIRVGDERGTIAGTLSWTPLPDGGAPWLLIGVVVVVLCDGLAVLAAVRARRRDEDRTEAVEAW